MKIPTMVIAFAGGGQKTVLCHSAFCNFFDHEKSRQNNTLTPLSFSADARPTAPCRGDVSNMPQASNSWGKKSNILSARRWKMISFSRQTAHELFLSLQPRISILSWEAAM